MTASFITEKDSADVDRKILTELIDTDKHAPAGVLWGKRTDTIADVSEANGAHTQIKASRRGALLVELASGLDSTLDSVYARPYGQGATPSSYGKRFTAAAGENAIAAPGTGFRLVITNCRISTRGTVAAQVSVFQDTDGDGAYDAGEPLVADDDYAPTALVPTGSKSGPLHIVFAENKPCYVKTASALVFTLMLDYLTEPMPV